MTRKIDKLPVDLDTYKLMEKIFKKDRSKYYIPYTESKPYNEYDFLKTLEERKLRKSK